MSSNSWSHSGGTTTEESKPGGELYSIKRDGDHCCGVGEGQGDTAANKTRASNPTAAAGSLHATTKGWINSLWRALLSVGKDEHPPLSPPSPFISWLPLLRARPSLPTPAGSISGALMKLGWGLMLWIRGDRWESLKAAELRGPLAWPATLSHACACCDVIIVWTRMSKWMEGGGVKERVLRETSSAAAKASFQQTQLSLNILGSEFLQRCDVLWQRIDFILIDAMTATLSRVHQNIVFI